MSNINVLLLSFYHDCIITIPHDHDADFGLELDVNGILFQLYPCLVVWQIDAGTEKMLP